MTILRFFGYVAAVTAAVQLSRAAPQGQPAGSSIVGVLEGGQCEDSGKVAVRVLFAKSGPDWVSVVPRGVFERAVPTALSWTIALDGVSLGSLRTTDPRAQAGFPWSDERRRRLTLVPGQRVPQRSDPAHRFGGWCEEVSVRPLVVVIPAHASDPESWKPFLPPANLRATLFPAFQRAAANVLVCPTNPEKAVPFKYVAGDLRLVAGYQSRTGRRIVAVELNPKANNCDGVSGPEWGVNWFAVDSQPRFLGADLQLVDAGDYDGDGRSELLFWYSGYNRDGYTLYANDLRARIDHWWSYH